MHVCSHTDAAALSVTLLLQGNPIIARGTDIAAHSRQDSSKSPAAIAFRPPREAGQLCRCRTGCWPGRATTSSAAARARGTGHEPMAPDAIFSMCSDCRYCRTLSALHTVECVKPVSACNTVQWMLLADFSGEHSVLNMQSKTKACTRALTISTPLRLHTNVGQAADTKHSSQQLL